MREIGREKERGKGIECFEIEYFETECFFFASFVCNLLNFPF